MQRVLLYFLVLLLAPSVSAEIPDFYKPLVVQPPFSYGRRLIDLTPAFVAAKQQSKPLFIHFGANNGATSMQYSRFLEVKRDEMKPILGEFFVVDIRTWAEGPEYVFQIGSQTYSLTQFKRLIGDTNEDFALPYYWLLSADKKVIRQLDQRPWRYLSVAGHRQALDGL